MKPGCCWSGQTWASPAGTSAATAPADERDGHAVADLPPGDPGPDLHDHAGQLVTRDVRERDVVVARPGVPVAPAHAGGPHLDDHPGRPVPSDRHLPDLGSASDRMHDHGAHPGILPADRRVGHLTCREPQLTERTAAGSPIAATRGSAHRCSRSATAATPPGGTASASDQVSSSETSPSDSPPPPRTSAAIRPRSGSLPGGGSRISKVPSSPRSTSRTSTSRTTPRSRSPASSASTSPENDGASNPITKTWTGPVTARPAPAARRTPPASGRRCRAGAAGPRPGPGREAREGRAAGPAAGGCTAGGVACGRGGCAAAYACAGVRRPP